MRLCPFTSPKLQFRPSPLHTPPPPSSHLDERNTPASPAMPSPSAATAAGGGSIPAGTPSTLSPNAAPYTFLALQPRAPSGRIHDGDALRLIDDNFALNGEGNSSHSASLATHFGTKSSDAVYPIGAHGISQTQPISTCGIPASVYPPPSSPIAIVSEPSVTIASDSKQLQIPLTSVRGCKYPKVTIRSPPNKTSETNSTGFGSISRLAVRQNDKSNKETGKGVSFHGNLESSNPDNGNPEFSMKPHAPSACVTAADDVNPDPSECSVDSPCWRGTASRPSPFDIPQSVKQESVAFDARQEQCSSTDSEAPTKLQNLVASKSKQNHPQTHVELDLSKKSGGIGPNLTQDSNGKELEFVNHGATKFSAEKHSLSVVNDFTKRPGLNYAAPDFIPLSVRKSNAGNATGSCSSSGTDISGILKEMKCMSEVLCNNCFDEIELEEHDHCRLQSVIDNLQICLRRARKVPVKGASDKAGGLKACYSQNEVPKSVTGNYNGSFTGYNGEHKIIPSVAGASRLLSDLRKKDMTGYQEISCEEEHSQALIYKGLWIDAERANCALKYELKQTRMGIDLESNMAHIGGGPRNPSFHLCDMDADPSSSYGSAITCPPMLKNHPEAKKNHNLLYAADHIQSGESTVLSRPMNIKDEYFLSGLEESGVHLLVHSDIPLATNRAHGGLNARASTSNGMSSLPHITGRDGIIRGSCEFGSSDWEHVLKEEIGPI